MALAVLYANSDHREGFYLREAEASADSFRRYLPGATFVLYTNAPRYRSPAFDRIVSAPFVVPPQLAGQIHLNGQMLVKHQAMVECGAERVLVLGSDVFSLRPAAGDMLRLLERFDVVAAHAPHRINTSRGNSPLPEIPTSFPEFNCDLILYNNTPAVRATIIRWQEMYASHTLDHPHDQGSFRYLMYQSDHRIATLPPEYNYRGPGVWDKVAILQNRDLLPAYQRRLAGREAAMGRLWRRAWRRLYRSAMRRGAYLPL